jgi:hypothetical protein
MRSEIVWLLPPSLSPLLANLQVPATSKTQLQQQPKLLVAVEATRPGVPVIVIRSENVLMLLQRLLPPWSARLERPQMLASLQTSTPLLLPPALQVALGKIPTQSLRCYKSRHLVC